MKKSAILLCAFFGVLSAFSQKYEYYSREITDNGVLSEVEAPVLLSINLVVGSVTISDAGIVEKTKLNADDIIYSSDSPSSQVVIWELLQETGPHKMVVYNYDKVADERELCFLMGVSKKCYLNIFPFK